MLARLRRFLRRILGLPPTMASRRHARQARPGDYVVVEVDGIAHVVPRSAACR